MNASRSVRGVLVLRRINFMNIFGEKTVFLKFRDNILQFDWKMVTRPIDLIETKIDDNSEFASVQ